LIAKNREQFVRGAREKGLTETEAEELFGLIEKFAGYGFNKSHSTAYALVAYMTAYLKAHYPVEFMAALLSSDMSNRNFTRKDSTVEHLEDCQRMKIEVVPPDVNASFADYAVNDGKIYYAMAAVKGCGGGAAEAIVANRRAKGPFRSLFDFCERLDPGAVSRTAIESLIKAGAFDAFGVRRSQLFSLIERAMQSGAAAAADRRRGQRGLFGDDDDADKQQAAAASLPDIPEWEPRDKLAKEKEVLGFYLTSHPLAEHQKTLQTYCSHSTVEAAGLGHRTEVMLGGMLAAIKLAHTKNPQPNRPSKYAMFDLEDMQGIMRCILWPEQYVEYGELVQPDAILVVIGVVDKRPGSDEANLIVNELIPLDQLQSRYTRGVMIRLQESTHGLRAVEQLYEILRGYPGKSELKLAIWLADGRRVQSDCKMRIEINGEMCSRVEELLGPGNFRLLPAPHVPKSGGRGNGRPNGRPVRA
jgi:DNA polymerase-3 subunit alpha